MSRLFLFALFWNTVSYAGGIDKRYPFNFPKISCLDAWGGLKKKGLHHYLFDRDSIESSLGNIGYQAYAERVKRKSCFKEWTLLVYMAGDNDLSPYARWDVYEMERRIKGELNLGASTEKTDVLVELDTFDQSGIRRLHIFQTDKEYEASLLREDFLKRKNSEIESPIVKWFAEKERENLQSTTDRLKSFLSWGIQNYPAKNYMVVIWGHGEGFIGRHSEKSFPYFLVEEKKEREKPLLSEEDVNPGFDLPAPVKFPLDKVFGGIAFDSSDESYIDIPSLNEVLGDLSKKFLANEPIDIFAMDACLMQSVEVAAELADHTRFIVGSTQIQNYLGLPYRTIIDQMNQGRTVYEMAKGIPHLVERAWGQWGYQYDVDNTGFDTFTISTLSSWSLRYELIPQLDRLGVILERYIEERSYRRFEVDFILEKSPSFLGETRDLGTFLGTLEKLIYEEVLVGKATNLSYGLRKEVRKTHRQILKTMTSYTYGPTYYEGRSGSEYLLGYFKGLSIWLPSREDFYHYRENEMLRSRYFNYGEKSWASWLKKQFKPLFDLDIEGLGLKD